jgi:hypothetical protein
MLNVEIRRARGLNSPNAKPQLCVEAAVLPGTRKRRTLYSAGGASTQWSRGHRNFLAFGITPVRPRQLMLA